MAINEEIVTGRKFRKCIDVANKLWQRISFWTMACDVWFADGKNAEEKLGNVDKVVNELKNKITSFENIITSFENTKSTIVSSALGRALGMAASNTWAQIVSKISSVVNRGAYSSTITTENGSVTIPAGYHNGSGKVTVSGLYKIVTIGTFKIISSGGFSVQKNVTSTVVFTDIIEDHSAFQLNSGKAYARVAMTKLQISMDYNFGNEYGNVTHKWTVNLYKNGSRISTISDSNVNSQGKGCIANFGTFSCNAGDYFYVVAIGSQDTYSEGAGDGHPSISNCVLNLTSQS